MAYRTILLAYDGSNDGRRVLTEGADLAKGLQAKIHLLAVITPKSGHAVAQSLAGTDPMGQTQFFESTVEDGVRYFRKRGIDVVGHTARGEPAEEIAKLAKEVQAELVVVGHRAQGPLARWWNTPTCVSLLDAVDCAVLVCRHEGDAETTAEP